VVYSPTGESVMDQANKKDEAAHKDLLAQREETIAQLLQHEAKAKSARADLASIGAKLLRLGADLPNNASW
jgi:hypothetical protein